ncbi:PqiC family protein [Pseudomonas sp. HR96]|uniref:PqiC family protein n=1 Tax=Pseudomonas sp. HR96 TaxID=1027966 RepID=UPI002A766217|nr:PqiC family protein [Pseudomonas sp. HR96]WPO99547.1 PqiC family protein [Pseudomonas sp. HR96]
MTFLRLPALLLTGALALAGCAGHAPVALYQLDSGNPGQPRASSGMSVLLGPVAIADYLQHDTLLQRQPDGSLRAASDGRWAGSLSADIDQLLLRQLAWRLDSSRVSLAPTPSASTPDVQVQLSITRLDSGDNLPAVLDAQWRVLDRRGQVRDNRIVHLEQKHLGGTAAQVKAQGLLLQRLAEQLSVALKPLANQPALADEKKAPKVPKEAMERPKMPIAAPVRTEMEIFRF